MTGMPRRTSSAWTESVRAGAAERILDAASESFAERGVAAVGMDDIARAAGCSRATLYRYFPNRDALRSAYVLREMTRALDHLADEPAAGDPSTRLVSTIEAALRYVREHPALMAWFASEDFAVGPILTENSEALVAGAAQSSVGAILPPMADPMATDWIVRTIVGLLSYPGPSAEYEHELLVRFIGPLAAPR